MSVLYLIDVSGFIFRAFYALPALTRADGEPIGAVYGFCSMLMKLRNVISFGTPPMNQLEGEDKSDPSKDIILWAGVFDVSRQTFRSEICPTYKANRKQTPHELISQFGLIREACTVFGCAVKEMQNYEADDVIASYARKAQEQGISVVIVSSDKDLMQLYRPGVSIYDPMKSVWITEAHIYEKFGVKPSKVVEVQALAGDPTDGV
ncbi:MAG: hypothetical protein LBQ43_00650, partial [Holosporales bacterium]|nr:hypothetical protein [Holosporales bacterium]